MVRLTGRTARLPGATWPPWRGFFWGPRRKALGKPEYSRHEGADGRLRQEGRVARQVVMAALRPRGRSQVKPRPRGSARDRATRLPDSSRHDHDSARRMLRDDRRCVSESAGCNYQLRRATKSARFGPRTRPQNPSKPTQSPQPTLRSQPCTGFAHRLCALRNYQLHSAQTAGARRRQTLDQRPRRADPASVQGSWRASAAGW